MAYTNTIEKATVAQISPTEFNVSIKATFYEDGVVALEGTYIKRYTQGQNIDIIKEQLLSQLQVDWDRFVAERSIYNSVAFDTMCSVIQTIANTYINS